MFVSYFSIVPQCKKNLETDALLSVGCLRVTLKELTSPWMSEYRFIIVIILSTIMPCYDLLLLFKDLLYYTHIRRLNAGWQQSTSELLSHTSSNSLLNLFTSLWRHFWQSWLFFTQQTLSHMFSNFSALAVIICNVLVFTHSSPICSTLRQAISHYLTHHPHCQCWRVGDLWNCISNPRA